MTDANVVLYTRIAGRESFGYPAVNADGLTMGASLTIAAPCYIQNASGQGDLTWSGAEFGLTAPTSGGQTPNVWLVSVTLTHCVSSVSDFSAITAQLYDGSTPVGNPASFTLSVPFVTDTITLTTGFPAADLADLALQVTWHAIQPGLAFVSHAYAEASYSYPSAVGIITTDPAAVIPQAAPTVVPPVARLVSAGPGSFTLSPSFGRPTTAGNLLVAWVSANSPSSTFDVSTTAPGWLLAGVAGQPFNWESMWYKPGCGHAESPPVFTSASGQATAPQSGLMEFTGARYLDQAGGVTGTTSMALAAASSDTASGDLIVAFATWGTSSPGPAAITMTGTDSSGATLPLSVSSNASSTGDQFWVTGWAQASTGAGPGVDTVTAGIGMFGGGGGIVASFKALTVTATPPPVQGPAIQQRVAVVPIRAGH